MDVGTCGGRRLGVAPIRFRSLALALGALIALPGVVAASETYVVNTTVLVLEASPDGACDSDAGAPVQCTLTEAIAEANADPDVDTIEFEIGGPDASGIKTITMPFEALPDIVQPLVIDGYTQPGASPNTASKGTNAKLRVVIDGPCSQLDCSLADVIGFDIKADGVTIRGLVIGDFGHAIRIDNEDAVIAGNFIGTNAAGTGKAPNEGNGVLVRDDEGRIGGTARADRNLISGNVGSGIRLLAGALETRVQGNLIGTDRTGTAALGNGGDGVEIRGTGYADPAAEGVVVGGSTNAAANVIAFNTGDGVRLDDSVSNDYADHVRILRNSIFANSDLAIDLYPLGGRNENDFNDGDLGANHLQNYPVISSVRSSATRTTIKGRLNSFPNEEFLLQFFSNPSGNEARTFLGQKKVTNTITGYVDFTFTPGRRVPVGHTVTATATNLDPDFLDTSELSRPKTVKRR